MPVLCEYSRKELLPILCDCFYICFCAAPDRAHDASYDPIDFDACQYNPFAYNTCSCCACCDVELMEEDSPDHESIELGNISDAYRDRDTFFGVNPTGRMRPRENLASTQSDSNVRSDDDDDEQEDECDDSDEELSDSRHKLAIMPTQSRHTARQLHVDIESEAKSDEEVSDDRSRSRSPFVPRNMRRVGAPLDGVTLEGSVSDDDVLSSQAGHSSPPDDEWDSFDEQFDMTSRRGHYDQDHRLRSNYARVTLMLQLVTCFGSALPGCFLIMFLYVLFEMKSAARKLSYVTLRPFPVEEEGIMAWTHVLHALVYAAVLVNAALIAFSMEQFQHWKLQFKLLLFIAVCTLCATYRCALRLMMSDIPPEVTIQQMRARFINSKLIHQVPDQSSNSRAVDLL